MSKKGFTPADLLLPLHITAMPYQPLFYVLLPYELIVCFKFFLIVFTIVSVTMVDITIVIFAMVIGGS
jgi:hypothetical protein